MLNKYKQEVKSAYLKKLREGQLSENLARPTRAKLKEECLQVYRERKETLNAQDKNILKEFLGLTMGVENFEQNISNFDEGRFRALDNFLKGETDSPHVRVVDLLAWLIDFQPRPFINWPPTNVKPISIFERLIEMLWNIRFNYKMKILSALIIAIITTGSTYIYLKHVNKECMYWAGDHYEPISCNENVNASLIPFDEKIANLRKITKPDTLTKNAIGSVWYVKVKVDSAEFYTESGEYPLDRRKRLLPITEYMLNKYVFSKKTMPQK